MEFLWFGVVSRVVRFGLRVGCLASGVALRLWVCVSSAVVVLSLVWFASECEFWVVCVGLGLLYWLVVV